MLSTYAMSGILVHRKVDYLSISVKRANESHKMKKRNWKLFLFNVNSSGIQS